MNAEKLSLELAELLTETRSAGRGLSEARLALILDDRFPRLVALIDPYEDETIPEASRQSGMERFVEAVRNQANSSMDRPTDADFSPDLLRRVGRQRVWYWSLGLASAAAFLLVICWYAGLFGPKRDRIARPAPRHSTPDVPPSLKRPERSETPVVRQGPETKMRVEPLPKRPNPDERLVMSVPQVATFGSVVGEPMVFAVGEPKGIAAKPGMAVAYGSRIETGDFSRAQVMFPDGTDLSLEYNTTLEFDSHPLAPDFLFKGVPQGRPDRVSLHSGRLIAKVTHLPQFESFRVRTPVATAAVLGTEFGLEIVRPMSRSTALKAVLQVKQGKVAFYNEVGRVVAGDMMETTVVEGSAPTEPKRRVIQGVFLLDGHKHRFVVRSSPLAEELGIGALEYPFADFGLKCIWSPGAGAIVHRVRAGTPAYRAGLREDDVIVEVNRTKPETHLEFNRALWLSSDRWVQLSVHRGSRTVHVRIDRPVSDGSGIRQNLRRVHEATRPALEGRIATAIRRLEQLLAREQSAAAHFNLGVLHQTRDQMGFAIRHLQAAVRSEPGCAKYRRALGWALAEIGNWSRAIEEFLTASRLEPKHEGTHSAIVYATNLAGLSDLALERADAAIRLFPGSAQPLSLKALVLLTSRRFREALEAGTEALKRDPKDVVAISTLSEVHHVLGDLQESIKLGRRLTELRPESSGAWSDYAGHLVEGRRFDEAELAIRRALKLDSRNIEAMLIYGNLLFEKRQFEESEATYRKALSLDQSGEAAYQLGTMLGELNRVTEAEDMLRRSIAAAPLDIRAYINLGSVFFKQRRFDEAEDLYKRSAEIAPNEITPRLNLGILYRVVGRIPEAEHQFKNAVAENPMSVPSLLNLANLYVNSSRIAEADGLFRRALTIEPDNHTALVNLGLILARSGRHREASELWQRALQLRHDDARTMALLGSSYLEHLGKPQEGLSLLRKAVELTPEDFYATSNLAWFLIVHEQDLHQALNLAQRASQMRPSDMNALSNVGWAYYKLGKLNEAEPYLAKALIGTSFGESKDAAETWWVLGMVYERTLRKEQAIGAQRKALALDPTLQKAQEALKRLAGFESKL